MIGVNIYRFRFKAVCPADGDTIDYEAEIVSRSMIRVEEINETTGAIQSGFHEAIADQLWAKFQGRQEIRAVHQRVEIRTRREPQGWATGRGDEETSPGGELRH